MQQSHFDKYNQYRRIVFAEGGGGYRIDDRTRIEGVFNYARALYRQDTIEDVFPTATTATFAPAYVGNVAGIPLLKPNNLTAFDDLTSYVQDHLLDATDRSTTNSPQLRIDLIRREPAANGGFGFQAGYNHRLIKQDFFYHENRINPVAGAGINLATAGGLIGTLTPPDSGGVQLIFLDPTAVSRYIAANPQLYVTAGSNVARSILNNFNLRESVDGGYAQGSYRTGPLYVQAGLRYEHTSDDILTFQPSPLTSTTNFAGVRATNKYDKLLPEVNITVDATDQLKIRGAVSRTLARPRFSDLAQNASLTLSGTIATQTIANPNLKPRSSTNYDLSFEYYPNRGSVLSLALFEKDISDEIFSLTTTTQNVALPGYPGNNYTLISTTPSNVGSARIRGLELGLNYARLDFLPGMLANFGTSLNLTLIDQRAPSIQMSDRVTFRQLPQLLESSNVIANAQLFYRYQRFSGQVAYNHTGKFPINFDRTNAVNDQFYRATDTIDAQLSYRIRPKVEIRVQGKNLTNETNQKVVGQDQALNYSLLDNGRAYYFGIGFAF